MGAVQGSRPSIAFYSEPQKKFSNNRIKNQKIEKKTRINKTETTASQRNDISTPRTDTSSSCTTPKDDQPFNANSIRSCSFLNIDQNYKFNYAYESNLWVGWEVSSV